jgi:hypothetical protein
MKRYVERWAGRLAALELLTIRLTAFVLLVLMLVKLLRSEW